MHGSFERSGRSDNHTHRSWSVGLFALPALVVIGLIGLAIAKPAMSGWISQAVEAEFTGIYVAPELAPTQLARPAMELRSARVN
jgi:hypothetical protein